MIFGNTQLDDIVLTKVEASRQMLAKLIHQLVERKTHVINLCKVMTYHSLLGIYIIWRDVQVRCL